MKRPLLIGALAFASLGLLLIFTRTIETNEKSLSTATEDEHWSANPNRDQEAMQRLLTLSRQPTTVLWTIRQRERDAWDFYALLQFSREDAEALMDGCPPYRAGSMVPLPRAIYDHWLPPALRAELATRLQSAEPSVAGQGKVEQPVYLPAVMARLPDPLMPEVLGYAVGEVISLGDGYLFVHHGQR